MTLPPSIRVNVRAPFPPRVTGSGPVEVTKANGIWKLGLNYEILNPVVEVTPTQIVAVQDQITGAFAFITVQQLLVSALSSFREQAGGGTITVEPTDITILVTGSPGSPTNIQLPSSATRAGAPVKVKDLTQNASTQKINFTPALGETIDGYSAAQALANGVGSIAIDGGFKTLNPLSSGGWYVSP